MHEFIKGEIGGMYPHGNGLELHIRYHRGIFKTDGEVKLVLDKKAIEDFVKHYPVKEVIGGSGKKFPWHIESLLGQKIIIIFG